MTANVYFLYWLWIFRRDRSNGKEATFDGTVLKVSKAADDDYVDVSGFARAKPKYYVPDVCTQCTCTHYNTTNPMQWVKA